MINEIKKYAIDNNVPIILDDGIKLLNEVILDNNVSSVLEIGSAIGYSAIMMCLNKNDLFIDTIEKSDQMYELACENISKVNLNDRINIIHGDGLYVPLDVLNTYDLIFIDAAKAQSRKFLERYEGLLNNNGIIVVDNIDFHGLCHNLKENTNRNTVQMVRKINEFKDWLMNNKKYDVTYHVDGDGMLIARKRGV